MNADIRTLLDRLGVPQRLTGVALGREWHPATGSPLVVRSPIDGAELAVFGTAMA